MKKQIKSFSALAVSVIMAGTVLASCGSDSGDGAYYAPENGGSPNYIQGDVREEAENNDTVDEVKEAEGGFYDSIAAEEINTEEYDHFTENEFLSVAEHPLSTFSTDVDTASYTNVRRMINNGYTVTPDAVRTEEFINYFKYDYPMPEGDDKISITAELSDCPWNTEAKLMQIGLQAQLIETKDIDSNLVFLIDVSGSMYSDDKLPLVQQAFSMLAENLGQNDRVSIVTYAGSDKVALEGENGGNYQKIADTLNGLTAGGSTAGAAGINTAYEIAEKYFIEGGNNRVILATDGDLNVGVSSQEGLVKLIESKRDQGIFLSVLGFGMGNYKDNKLEAIADNGNGNYAYIDSLDEARRVLVSEMNGTMFTVAKDTKVQVEFNPANVAFYKLVGYENRLLADEDFEDDTKDAGDIGAGQQVTVLYEIIPVGGEKPEENQRTLKYQQDVAYPTKTDYTATLEGLEGELLTVSVRYKEPDEDESKLLDYAVNVDSYVEAENISANMAVATGAAMFARALKGSNYGEILTPDEIVAYLAAHNVPEQYSELSELIEDYSKLI